MEYHTSHFTFQSPANKGGPGRPEQALQLHITLLTGIRDFLLDLINSLPEEHLTCSCVKPTPRSPRYSDVMKMLINYHEILTVEQAPIGFLQSILN